MRLSMLLITMLVAGSATSIAWAAIPRTDKATTIVIGKSIGEAKLGQTRSAGESAWGSKARCGIQDGLNSCIFGMSASSVGFGQFIVVGGKITQIRIALGTNPTTKAPQTKSPLATFKTDRGIGLGSTQKQLLKAYPEGAKFTGPSLNSISMVRVTGPGKAETDFILESGVVTTVHLDDGVTGG